MCTGRLGYFAILGGLRAENMQKFFEKYSWQLGRRGKLAGE
ncbi:hypothetical protein PSP6_210277 [Paraburkholderia tropica]|nr:hypothetical protein PSP6_210277 [Paraburkholderia tropica]